MKRIPRMTTALLTGLCAVAMAATPSVAQDGQTARPKRDRARVGKLDAKTRGATIRASQMIGKNIQNEQGKSLGEIHDLVVDANSGRIRYAAVTYGGFLGLGDKLFAVPWDAFDCRQHPQDKDEYLVVLDVTQQQLEGATGFDQDRWPNFADRNFTRELDERYGVERRQRRARRQKRDVDVNVDRRGVDVDVEAKPKRDR